jgi:hypothetical protein
MSWEAIGALGELLGGLVVLASLAFLAIQIRRHTQALRVSSSEESNRQFAAYTALFTQPGIARIYRVGLASPEDLDQDELITFNAVLTMLFNFLSHNHSLRAQGIDALFSSEEGLRAATLYVLRQPGGQAWWRRFRVSYRRSFCEFIDSLLDPAAQQGVAADQQQPG